MLALNLAPKLRQDVSALYIDPRGPYGELVADVWDEKRDARNYARVCSAQQRRRTPWRFAVWLVDLAAQARR